MNEVAGNNTPIKMTTPPAGNSPVTIMTTYTPDTPETKSFTKMANLPPQQKQREITDIFDKVTAFYRVTSDTTIDALLFSTAAVATYFSTSEMSPEYALGVMAAFAIINVGVNCNVLTEAKHETVSEEFAAIDSRRYEAMQIAARPALLAEIAKYIEEQKNSKSEKSEPCTKKSSLPRDRTADLKELFDTLESRTNTLDLAYDPEEGLEPGLF